MLGTMIVRDSDPLYCSALPSLSSPNGTKWLLELLLLHLHSRWELKKKKRRESERDKFQLSVLPFKEFSDKWIKMSIYTSPSHIIIRETEKCNVLSLTYCYIE